MQSTDSRAKISFRMEDIPDFESLAKEKVNPLDSVVKKIERAGYTLEQCFQLFDDNDDKLLTI